MTENRSPRELAEQFVGACGAIQQELARRLGVHRRRGSGPDGLMPLTHELLSSGDRQVRFYFHHLSAFASLRNAIAHDRYREGRPIAAPFPETVAAVIDLHRELTQPTTIGQYLHVPVTVETTTLLAEPLRTMVTNEFSQLPAYHEGTYQGLLTTNAIARWVGAHLDDTIMELSVPVSQVLDHAEDYEKAEFVARNLSAVEAIDRLTGSEKPPVALLVTQNGNPRESALGLLTVADLAAMYREITVPMP